MSSQGAGIAAEDNITVRAGRDVNLLAEESVTGSSSYSKKKTVIDETVRQQGTEIASGGDTTITAGRDIATTELVPMKPDQKRLNKEYLAYYLRSKPFVEWVSTQVSGAKMPRVVMSIFWQHEMPLPPLYEQERIVSVLDKSNRLRQKREQAIK
ncbi:restriction endonuclease subunit S, partial [Enterobacter cloacae]|uniref:restriction endonuclease subunit S n=1 Tax=Enterobacter cloacae TaxID=550 RepID=UPI00254BA1BE